MRRKILLALSALSLGSSVLVVPAEAIAATTYRGTTYSDPWGAVTVTVGVGGKKIASLNATSTYHTPRSYQIVSFALPVLKKEALKAGSYKINAISGATLTSEAFIYSLKSALHKAHLA
jgi:uncharacterized protein with FMN-binding domain